MQCPACRAVYSNGLELCPRCKTPASNSPTEPEVSSSTELVPETAPPVSTEAERKSEPIPAVTASTLIEFPGARSMPQWRKQLSERVREIQERRARDSTRDLEEAAQRSAAQSAVETAASATAPPLGLVPQPEVPEMNPIVVAALRRIERARETAPPVTRARRGGGAAAAARVMEDEYQEEISTLASPLEHTELTPAIKTVEAPREHNLVVVPPVVPVVKEEAVEKPEPKRVIEGVVDDTLLAQMDAEVALEDEYDDRAATHRRIAASLVDLLVVAFASSPFAAVIELTNGNWADPRVAGSMAAIVMVVMFLYSTASTVLAGRTWGMSLLRLHAVDANTGLLPTTRQAVARTLVYMLSLAALGLGVIYALFDAEGRTAHDHLSNTAVVRD